MLLGDQPGHRRRRGRARARRAGRGRTRRLRRACPGIPSSCGAGMLARAGELAGDAGFRDLLGGATRVECGDLGDPRDVDTHDDLEVMER